MSAGMATIVPQVSGRDPDTRWTKGPGHRPGADPDRGREGERVRRGRADELLRDLSAPLQRRTCLTHVEHVPARPGRTGEFPEWTDPRLREHLADRGITAPWTHQEQAAQLAHEGRHVVLSTATASGKSLAYLLPSLSAIGARELDRSAPRATALYLAPTKALAADQLTNITALADGAELRDARVAVYDGDTPTEQRRWIRRHGTFVLTNPDMLHFGILPGHEQWASFLRALKYVIVDECHSYRGVFGSHVAMVLRRLRRVAAAYRSDPTFVLASATTANPELSAARLIGQDVVAVTEDGSPRGGVTFGLWEPGTRSVVDGRRPTEASRTEGSRTEGHDAETADDHDAERSEEPPAALGHERGRGPARGSRAARRADPRLRPLPPRRRAGLHRCPAPARAGGGADHGRRPRPPGREDRRLPRGLPRRGAAGARGRPALGRAACAGLHQRPRAGHRHLGPRCRADRRLAGHARLALAAGRTRRTQPGG
jgi:hypothetical protein